MKEKTTRGRLVELKHSFESLKTIPGMKFAYAIAKNGVKITAEIKNSYKGYAPDEKYREYESKRIGLCEKLCNRDTKNQLIIQKGEYAGLVGNKKFETEFQKLNNEYKETLAKREEQVKKLQAILDEEIDFEFFKIKQEDLPANITAAQLESIIEIVE